MRILLALPFIVAGEIAAEATRVLDNIAEVVAGLPRG